MKKSYIKKHFVTAIGGPWHGEKVLLLNKIGYTLSFRVAGFYGSYDCQTGVWRDAS